ncbi:polyprenyl synthetase family protein [Hoeflea poritis]|uniref:Polyprenyl synthetase family protein n=1 Tax=Hoeflea poritis TaxID=2993659 RepID=A0ABT4VPP7_9HYPH|nr:polyprenyl synthetase family protein [Hoeflea poritis]MDA4846685.1 polyprenyl synthetase family protein [Hoeflea poritis]
MEVNESLDRLLPEAAMHPSSLHRAMRYSILAGGKRIRPVMCILVSEASGGVGRDFAVRAGCAIECVHTASLILDDLPSMDDAELRRGRKTTHREFSEATAILASIGLLNLGYAIITQSQDTDPEVKVQALDVLCEAVGSKGMIAGQEIDLHERHGFSEVSPIENLNWLKTGALFVASAQIGALAAGLNPSSVDAVKDFAKHVGLAFQTADDLIDHSGDIDAIGKDVGQDEGVPTLVSLSGDDAARLSCEENLALAHDTLRKTDLDSAGLLALVDSIFGSKI